MNDEMASTREPKKRQPSLSFVFPLTRLARPVRLPLQRFVVATVVLFSGGGHRAVAQASGGLFFDTVEVRLVNVEVMVTDKEGRPVTDLEREDFLVLEDGEPVEISNFFAVEGRRVKESAGSSGEPLGELSGDPSAQLSAQLSGDSRRPTPESFFYGPETRRLNLILFIDDMNMQPGNRNAVLDEVKKYLRESLDPRNRVMVVVLGREVEIVQPFTNDPGLLLGTIEELEMRSGGFLRQATEQLSLKRHIQRASLPPNPRNQGGALPDTASWEAAQQRADMLARDAERLAEVKLQRVLTTVRALESFTDSLAGIRGRKAVLYVSDGLPMRPADSLAQAWLNKFEDWIQAEDARDARPALQDMVSLVGGPRYDASRHFDRLVKSASAAGVVFYPLSNARKLRGSAISAEFQGSGTSTGRGAFSADVASLESMSLEASLLQMAHGTGGVAFTRTPNIGGLLEEVTRDFDTFYSLGYAPPSDDDKLHDIEVKVNREGLTVRHLGAHRLRDPVEQLTERTMSALQFGQVDNALGIELDPGEATPSGKKLYRLQVMVKIPFRNILLLPQEANHVGKLTLVVGVRDHQSGAVSTPQRIDVPLELPNERVPEVLEQYAAYPLQLELTGGRKRISVGVRDELARIDATVNVEVLVGEPLPFDGAGVGR